MPNYILLERIELNASAASVTFSNIPQSGYTDLKMVVSARCDAAYERRVLQLQFNGATTNYSDRYLQGYNGTASSGTNTGGTYIELRDIDGATATSNTFSNMEIYVPNYTSSNNKSVSTDGVTETNGALAMTAMTASLWASSAAITSVTLTPGNGSFVQYSTFSLYGLAAVGTTPVIAPKASGGNIQTDGTYWYHTFVSTGLFTPNQGLTCDYLVIAGGGSGAAYNGASGSGQGGGGAGGLRTTTGTSGGGGSAESPLSLSATGYAVTVGAGGAGITGPSSTYTRGNSGSDSTFATITSIGGGAGGAGSSTAPTYNPLTGGSGGGAGYTGSGAAGTANQGYAGGSASSGSSPYASAGGGGAGGVGGNPPDSSTPGAAGAGLANSITGTSVTYAAGGAGGTWNTTTTSAATANSGNGSGGAGNGSSGNGGSGVVIIRYLVA